MATCIVIQATLPSGPQSAQASPGLYTLLPWSVGEATNSGGQYSCPTGTHLLMSVAEVNAMPKAGVPDSAVLREHFFIPFALVLSCYVVGKMAGAILDLIKKG